MPTAPVSIESTNEFAGQTSAQRLYPYKMIFETGLNLFGGWFVFMHTEPTTQTTSVRATYKYLPQLPGNAADHEVGPFPVAGAEGVGYSKLLQYLAKLGYTEDMLFGITWTVQALDPATFSTFSHEVQELEVTDIDNIPNWP